MNRRAEKRSIGLFLVAALGCATAPGIAPERSYFGNIAIVAVSPASHAQLITEFDFRIEESRIAEIQPRNVTDFAFSREDDGCLHGQAAEQYCLSPSLADDEPATVRWRYTTSAATFSTRLGEGGRSIIVEAGRTRAIFTLQSDTPAIDEIVAHPWMLAVAFVSGAVPQPKARADGAITDFDFEVRMSDAAH